MLEDSLVSIIIVNWNGYEVTKECLLSLSYIKYQNYNVILVDNGSTDGSVENIQREFQDSKITLLRLARNTGFTGGNNAGIEYASKYYKPDYFLLLNNDTIVQENFLNVMLEQFKKEKVFAVVPKIYYFEPHNMLWFAGGKVSMLTGIGKAWGAKTIDTGRYNQPKDINYMNGCCALISAECVKSIGLLDDMFFANTEDVDYSMRIIKSGHRIFYTPEATIYHKVNYTFKKKGGQWLAFYLSTRNKILLFKKNATILKTPLFVIAFGLRWVLYLTLKLSLQKDFKSVKAIYLGISDGIRSKLRFVS